MLLVRLSMYTNLHLDITSCCIFCILPPCPTFVAQVSPAIDEHFARKGGHSCRWSQRALHFKSFLSTSFFIPSSFESVEFFSRPNPLTIHKAHHTHVHWSRHSAQAANGFQIIHDNPIDIKRLKD